MEWPVELGILQNLRQLEVSGGLEIQECVALRIVVLEDVGEIGSGFPIGNETKSILGVAVSLRWGCSCTGIPIGHEEPEPPLVNSGDVGKFPFVG